LYGQELAGHLPNELEFNLLSVAEVSKKYSVARVGLLFDPGSIPELVGIVLSNAGDTLFNWFQQHGVACTVNAAQ